MSHLDEDLLRCELLQREEWEVLKSIYPDCITSDPSGGTITLEVPIELGEPRTIILLDDNPIPSHLAHDIADLRLSLETLPPLLIHVIIPPRYPLHAPPQIVSARAAHSWFPHIHSLQQQLHEMWHLGEAVLYYWVEFIRSAEFLQSGELVSTTVHNTIRIPHPAPHLLAPLLRDYDASKKFLKFSENSYTCSICLTAYKGSRCLQLSCEHVFCRSCLQDFWSLCIAEGDVGRVGCPDPECIKVVKEANEEEVARVVSAEEVKRWRWLKDKRAFEKDPSTIHCPMSFCQAPTVKPVTEENTGYDRLRTCPDCNYSFCAFCKRTWHGPLIQCPISTTESFIHEYMALAEDSPSRQVMERQFGKSYILRLLAQWQEDQLNLQWLKASTMSCPGCLVNVEKSLGCNHMKCTKCKVHFCYRCGDKISDLDNLYAHWSDPKKECYTKLFDGVNE